MPKDAIQKNVNYIVERAERAFTINEGLSFTCTSKNGVDITSRVVLTLEYGRLFTESDIRQFNNDKACYNFCVTGHVGASYVIHLS
jgi:hypothetical protein